MQCATTRRAAALPRDRCAERRGEHAGDRGEEQHGHERDPSTEQQPTGTGEHGPLPGLLQPHRERHARPEDRPEGRRAATEEERLRAPALADPLEVVASGRDDTTDGANANTPPRIAPGIPAADQPTATTVFVTGPGVICPIATAERNWACVIQP